MYAFRDANEFQHIRDFYVQCLCVEQVRVVYVTCSASYTMLSSCPQTLVWLLHVLHFLLNR